MLVIHRILSVRVKRFNGLYRAFFYKETCILTTFFGILRQNIREVKGENAGEGEGVCISHQGT